MKSEIEEIINLQRDWSKQNTPPMVRRGQLIRQSCPDWLRTFQNEIAEAIDIPETDLLIEGRDGSGNKTEIPWVRFGSRELSPRATIGWYIVFLFNFDASGVYLSLGHGASKWTGQDFAIRPDHELITRSNWGRSVVEDLVSDRPQIVSEIDLKSGNSPLGPAYERSTAFAEYFDKEDIPSEATLKNEVLFFANLLHKIYNSSAQSHVEGDIAHEVDEANYYSNRVAGRRYTRTAGFRMNQRQRKAIENHAMKLAKEHLIRNGYSDIKNTSSSKPYDYSCSDGQDEIFVEVKGTQSLGEKIILTRNEVAHHKNVYPRNMLIVVSQIELTGNDNEVATGGTIHILFPWEIVTDQLEVISYMYDTAVSQ